MFWKHLPFWKKWFRNDLKWSGRTIERKDANALFFFIPLREVSLILNEHCCVIRSGLYSKVFNRHHLVLLEDLPFIVSNQSILKTMYRTSMSTDSIGRNASHAIIMTIGKLETRRHNRHSVRYKSYCSDAVVLSLSSSLSILSLKWKERYLMTKEITTEEKKGSLNQTIRSLRTTAQLFLRTPPLVVCFLRRSSFATFFETSTAHRRLLQTMMSPSLDPCSS